MLRESFPYPIGSLAILYFTSNNMQSPCRGRAAIPKDKVSGGGFLCPYGFARTAGNVRFIKGNQNRTSDLFCRPAAISPPLVLGRTYGRSRLRSAAPVSH